MAGWETVFDQQMDLWRFWRSDLGMRFLTRFLGDMRSKGTMPDGWEDQDIWNALASSAFNADPFYVSPEMMDVFDAAAESFVPEALHRTDVITSTGFTVFPRPVYGPDKWGKNTAWRAFSWMPCREVGTGREGIFVGIYSHNDDPDDYGRDEYGEGPEAEAKARMMLHKAFRQSYSLLHFTVLLFDETGDLERTEGVAEFEGWRQFVRYIQVFFRLTMQYVAERSRYEVPRAARRRADREKFPRKNVVVVKLRRPKSRGAGEERDVEWSCRWIVSGHWRNHWYPKLGIHRQVWISGYVKGPEDKELRLRRARAFELVR